MIGSDILLQIQLEEHCRRLTGFYILHALPGKDCEFDDFFFIQVHLKPKAADVLWSLCSVLGEFNAKQIIGCGFRPLCSNTELIGKS